MNDISLLRRAAVRHVLRTAAGDHTEFERPIRDRDFRQHAPKGPFLWLTHGGDLVRLRDMATPHVYYALRMIWNHSMPAQFRTPESIYPIKRYADVGKWSTEYRKAAINALSKELATRDPAGLTRAMQDGLRWMKMAVEVIIAKGI